MSSLSAKDRVSLCMFTFADGRHCRTPRISSHPHFCFYHAQKEARAQAADTLGKDLAYFFSGQYLSACDLSTALARLIPAVLRGDVKPRTAHTVAYLVQTLMQAIHISEHEYINAFGTDGWRKSVRNSVNGNYDYRFPPAPAPEPPPDQAPNVVAGLETGAGQAPQPAPPSNPLQPAAAQPIAAPQSTSQPAETSVNCHSERSEESAFSSRSPLATSHSPLPPAQQSAPSPHTSLPPTGAEFVRHVVAGLPRSERPGSTGKTGEAQAPQLAPAPSPASANAPQTPAAHTAPSSPVCHPDRRFRPCRKGSHPIPATQSARSVTPAVQPNSPPQTSPPTPQPAPNRDARALHFDDNYRLRIDGKPF